MRKCAAFDKLARLAHPAEAERFQLQHHDVRKAVVNLGEVHILGRHAGHAEGVRGGKAEADLEEIGAIRDVVRRVGVSFRDPHDVDGVVLQVERPLRRGHHHRTGAVRFQTAIKDAEGRRHHGGLEVLLHGQRTAVHVGARVVLGVKTAGESYLTHLFVRRAVQFPVPRRQPGVMLHRSQCAIGGIVIAQGLAQGVIGPRRPRQAARGG